MGKRKYQDEESIRRKIRKLEKRLQKNKRCLPVSSSDEEYNMMPVMELDEDILMVPREAYPRCESPPQPPPPSSPQPPQSSPPPLDLPLPRSDSPVTDSVQGMSGVTFSAATDETVPLPSTSKDPSGQDVEDIGLDSDILELFGDAPKTVEELGKPIHKEISNRWSDILLKGLSKENKNKILEEYLIPSNCQLLAAPALNPEAKAAVVEAVSKRDSSIMLKQKQLGVAIAALGTATENLLGSLSLLPQKQDIIKPLSDACRILCDLHYNETRTRRNFVLSSINTSLKEALINTTRDKFLFGDNVTEKLRTAKSIQRSGEALKNIPKPHYKNNFTPKPSYAATNKNRLNWKNQHRKTPNKPENPQRRTPPSTARQQFRNTQVYHRPSDDPSQRKTQRS